MLRKSFMLVVFGLLILVAASSSSFVKHLRRRCHGCLAV